MIELKVTDIIVISIMDKQTGNYENGLVTNRPRWKSDVLKSQIMSDDLIRIEVFLLGITGKPKHIFYSLEEFENDINL